MKVKGKTNYWVDAAIAVAFLVSLVSAIVLMTGAGGGYQGGRNSGYGTEVLFLGHDAWRDVHTWSSFAMVAGVVLHLVLHVDWIVCMTRNLKRRRNGRAAATIVTRKQNA